MYDHNAGGDERAGDSKRESHHSQAAAHSSKPKKSYLSVTGTVRLSFSQCKVDDPTNRINTHFMDAVVAAQDLLALDKAG